MTNIVVDVLYVFLWFDMLIASEGKMSRVLRHLVLGRDVKAPENACEERHIDYQKFNVYSISEP